MRARLLAISADLELEPGENVIFSTRASPLVPFIQLWPVMVGFIGWAGLNIISVTLFGQPAPALTEDGVLILSVILAVRWAIRDLAGYYVRWYTLTDRRIVASFGVFVRTRHETPVKHIQNIRMQRTNPIENLLDIGMVTVQTSSPTGLLELPGVRHPEEIARIITLQVREGARPGGVIEDARALLPPAAQAALLTLTQDGDDDPDDPNDMVARDTADYHLDLGILRRRIELPLLPGEQVVDRLYKHWFVLMLLLAPITLAGIAVVLALAFLARYLGPSASRFAWILTALAALATLIWDLVRVTNYIDDSFILTTERIIDVERSYFILAEIEIEAFYRNIQDVTIDLPLLGRIFGYGHLSAETAGRAPNIEMQHMARPRETQRRIFNLMAVDKQRRDAKEAKKARLATRDSLTKVLAALLVVTPNVRGLTVIEAAASLRAAGLSMAVREERDAPNMAPGATLDQTPKPGATALRGSEVTLVVSRRPAAHRALP